MGSRTRRWVGSLATSAIAASLAITAGPAASAQEVAADDLLLSYDFTQGIGEAVTDGSGNGHDAVVHGGAERSGTGITLDGEDDYVALPDDVLAGVEDITVSTEVLIDPAQATPYFLWGFGNTAADGTGNGYLFATGNSYRAAIASGNWSTEQGLNSGSNLERATWHVLTYTLADGTAALYLDGTEVATSAEVTLTPGEIGGGETSRNAIGRSVYNGDNLFHGSVRSFDVWDVALEEAQIADLVPDDADRLARDAAALSLGDTSAITADLDLPTEGGYGTDVTWSSSDPDVVADDGTVTRPASGEPNATVTLTATLERAGQSTERTFEVTVLAQLDPEAAAQTDLDALTIYGAEDVRGNITLPTTGSEYGSAIEWTASPEGVITTTETDGKPAGVVTRGASDTEVELTATVPGTEATRTITVTVTAAPVDLDDDYTAGYLWTHFAVADGYEQIFLGHSEDGLHWNKLNDNEPVLQNLASDLGVRDPHLIRSAEGDTYWIIGTDLHAEGGGPGGSGWDQLNASQNLVVWESHDLVNWSDQRIEFAGFEHAGNVWAPEAIWNEETGEYYVYWSARDQRHYETDDWALRVYVTKTRDFATFTEPEIWASLNEVGGPAGPNIIDSSIAYEDGIYYRFSTSDWHTVIDTSTSLDGPWETVVARGEATDHGLRERMEGLTVFQLPDERWAAFGDHNSYYGHIADTLADLEFTELAAGDGPEEFSFDRMFRHGSVLRLSETEEAAILEAYGDEPVDPGPDPVGLIAEYTFDDGSMDDSIGSNDLTGFGTAAVTEDAERGQVLELTGASGGYAEFPTGLFDGRDQLTVSLDMRSDRTSGNFFSFAFGSSDQEYYFLRTRGGDVRSAITQSSWQAESAVTGSVTSGEWHHYDIVFDDDTMAVYVDGAPFGENPALSATVSDLGEDLLGYLGRSLYAGDGYFDGAYDNVRIYDEALTAEDLLGFDQLMDISLSDPDALRIDPIVQGTEHTVTFPVQPGTDRSALAPTFTTPEGSSVTPASGTVVDLTEPVTYTVTGPEGEEATWEFSSVEMKSPVLPGLYADPNIVAFGDTYYIYATTDGFPGWGGQEFYVWSSKNLVDWERSEEPFLTLDGEDGNVPWAVGNAWAPSIIERDGKYYFYFSGHNSTYNRKTLGVAVADHPEGPFVAEPEAMILNNEEVTSGQAIDPAPFHDPESGKWFLYWGNGSPVYAELADDMVSLVPGSITRQEGLTGYREGSFMNYRDGIYHLTYSIDDTGSENYRVGYATSDSPHGPWTYRGVILQKDPSLGILGTGHSSILNVPGTDDWYIAYHRFAMPDGDGTHRETTIDRLTFDEDGYIETVTPTLESVDPQTIELDPEPEASFSDVPEENMFFAEIEWLASQGISTGWEMPDGSSEFRPLSPINRDAMAAFLYRMADVEDYTPPAVSPFVDVSTSNQFYTEIAWLYEEGISTGWSTARGLEFRPLQPIARDAMAAFLYRMAEEPEFTAPTTSPFADVSTSNQFYTEISWMADQGIAQGWDGNDGTSIFRPLNNVARDAMAAFLYRYAHLEG